MKRLWLAVAALLSVGVAADAGAEQQVKMNVLSDGAVGAPAGTVTVTETQYGVVFTPAMSGLVPGLHGFQVDEDQGTRDLPALYVDVLGNANNPVLAPRMKLADLKGRALVVHVGGDNRCGHPEVLARRVVCGVVE